MLLMKSDAKRPADFNSKMWYGLRQLSTRKVATNHMFGFARANCGNPRPGKSFASEINRWCGSIPQQCLMCKPCICLRHLTTTSIHFPEKTWQCNTLVWPSQRHPLAALVTSSLGKEQYHVCSLELFSKSDICKTLQKHHHSENTESNQLSIWSLNINSRIFQLNFLTWRMAVYNITEPATRPSRRAWRRSLFFKTFS